MRNSEAVEAQAAIALAADARCPAGCGSAPAPLFVLGAHRVVRCPDCGLYSLRLARDQHNPTMLDRTQFDDALGALRRANYARIMQRLGDVMPLGGRKLLDVGCSSGWFLQLASDAGCECYGIEPDAFFYRQLAAAPPPRTRVVQGLFAGDLPADWGPFDIITFHDVFEHLSEPAAALRAVRERLVAGGLLVLSLPMADGFVFQLARGLYQLGIAAPLERVFQIHYPYPHLFYFTRHSIVALVRRAGFEPVCVERLRSFSARGALHRAGMDRSLGALGILRRYASAGALVAFALVERLLPADNALAILRLRTT